MKKIGVLRTQYKKYEVTEEKPLGWWIEQEILQVVSKGFVPLFPIQLDGELLIVLEAEQQMVAAPGPFMPRR